MPNEARRCYDAASAEKRLGSKITHKQYEAIWQACGEVDVTADPAHLQQYARTGDRSLITDQEAVALNRLCEAAKAHLETASMKRRIWPRKVAAILAL